MPLDPELSPFHDIETRAPKLFNIVADPAERYDLSGFYPGLVKELSESYNTWFSDIFNDWERSNQEIIAHEKEYWEGREVIPIKSHKENIYGKYTVL